MCGILSLRSKLENQERRKPVGDFRRRRRRRRRRRLLLLLLHPFNGLFSRTTQVSIN